MRFIVCARDRQTGAMSLVPASSFANRREAVEAMIASDRMGSLMQADVFLVDLETSTPVALVPVPEAGREAGAEMVGAPVDGTGAPASDTGDEPDASVALEAEGTGDPACRMVEIDIEAWTCEDCIYVLTCEKSGALRPAECGSFQWRA